MTIDSGRLWALDTLGADGVRVRELVPDIVRDCHEKLANAQAEADMKHAGPYGNIWRRCLDQFALRIGKLPEAELVPVPRAGYELVCFNGVVLFPWRYAHDAGVEIGSRLFAISEARISIFMQSRPMAQLRFDIKFDHPELTEEERLHLEAQSSALEEVLKTHPRVVVIGYASNPHALHNIMWGEAQLTEDKHLKFLTSESLLSLNQGELVAVDTTDSFSVGPIPQPQLGVKEADGSTE